MVTSTLFSKIRNLYKINIERLTFDGEGFPCSEGAKQSRTFAIVARSNADGAIFILWYRSTSHDFRIAAKLSGADPAIGDTIDVFYPVD